MEVYKSVYIPICNRFPIKSIVNHLIAPSFNILHICAVVLFISLVVIVISHSFTFLRVKLSICLQM